MESLHLTRDLLRALHEGARNPGDIVPVVISHLFDLCPDCAEEFDAFQRELRSAADPYGPSFERVSACRGQAK